MVNLGQGLLVKEVDIVFFFMSLHTLQIIFFRNTLKDKITLGNGLIFVLFPYIFNQTLFMGCSSVFLLNDMWWENDI